MHYTSMVYSQLSTVQLYVTAFSLHVHAYACHYSGYVDSWCYMYSFQYMFTLNVHIVDNCLVCAYSYIVSYQYSVVTMPRMEEDISMYQHFKVLVNSQNIAIQFPQRIRNTLRREQLFDSALQVYPLWYVPVHYAHFRVFINVL